MPSRHYKKMAKLEMAKLEDMLTGQDSEQPVILTGGLKLPKAHKDKLEAYRKTKSLLMGDLVRTIIKDWAEKN